MTPSLLSRLRGIVLAGLVAFVSIPSAHAAEPVRRTERVEFSQVRSAWASHDGYRLYDRLPVPDDAGRIVLEAERAQVLTFQSGGKMPDNHPRNPRRDAAASGGEYIDWVQYAEYHFRTPRRTKLYAWYRFAVKGKGFLHYESLDDGGKRTVRDWMGEGGYAWVWMKEPRPLRAGAGEHVFRLHGYTMGARLDKIVLTPDDRWRPEGLGPDASPTVRLNEATFVTGRYDLPGVTGWRGVEVEGSLDGAGVEVAVSTDGGQTWRGADRPGAIPTNASDWRFRLTVRRGAEAEPVVRGLRLQYNEAPDARRIVEDDVARFEFHGRTGALLRAVRRRGDVAAVHLGEAGYPFELLLYRAGDRELTPLPDAAIAPFGCKPLPNNEGLVYRYRADTPQDKGGRIELAMTIRRAAPGRLDWDLSVENLGTWVVARTRFPIVGNARIGEDARDDVLMYPFREGQLVPDPVRGAATWQRGGPGSASMQWMDLYDTALENGTHTGLYLASRDGEHLNYTPECPPTASKGGLRLSFLKRHRILAGQRRTWPAAIALHKGDWHDGADIYRAWFHSAHGRYEPPSWFAGQEGIFAYHVQNHPTPDAFGRLATAIERARRVGLTHVQVWGQQTTFYGHCGYVIPHPSPLYGTIGQFKAAVDRIQRKGGTVGVYTRGEAMSRFDVYSDYFYGVIPKSSYPDDTRWLTEREYRAVKLLEIGESLDWPPDLAELERRRTIWNAATIKERRPMTPFRVYEEPCTWTPEWQDYIAYWVERTIGEWGLDAIYWDVLGARAPGQSFDPAKGHLGEGLYAKGGCAILENARRVGDAHGREVLQVVEYFGDVFGRYGPHLGMPARVFRYTLPDQQVWDYYTGARRKKSDKRIPGADAFLQGLILHGRYRYCSRENLERVVHFRQRLQGWNWPARYMDDVGLRIVPDDAPLEATWFLRDEPGAKGAAINVVASEPVERSAIALARGNLPAIRKALFLDWRGGAQAVAIETTDETLLVRPPATRAGTVVLISENDAPSLWTASAEIVDGEGDKGDSRRFVVHVVNFSNRPLPLKGRFVSSTGFEPAEDVSVEVPAESGQKFEFTLKQPAEPPKEQSVIEMELRGAGKALTRWNVVEAE
jgi:hypothetical protein